MNDKNNFRKQRRNENVQRDDPIILKKLSESYINYIEKPSTKFPKARFICKICPYHMDDINRAIKHSSDTIHTKNIKGISLTNLMKYLPDPTRNQLDAINDCLTETLSKSIFISDEESNRRKLLCNEMNSLAVKNGCQLIICGSLVTGLSLINMSDVNLYLEFDPKANSKISYLNLLKELSLQYEEKLELKTDIKLDKNNCGLFCKDSKDILYHISMSTHMYQLTSELLNVYMQIDDRANKLIKLFRYFANQAFIDKSRDGFFPPQVFAILVVFYLQQLQIPILPNLHKLAECHTDLPEKYVVSVPVKDNYVRYVSDLAVIKSLWKPPSNKSSIAQLWVGLMRFYAVEFDSMIYMVSIRSTEPLFKVDRNIVNKRLAVDDPFDYKRNLLFGWNSPDVIDFVKDQFQSCYIYFAVPQLLSGPSFFKVNFSEIKKETLMTTCLVTPTFKNNDFTVSVNLMNGEFFRLFEEYQLSYDISKWPVRLFVKICLKKILTSIFDSSYDIDCFIWLLEFKTSTSYFSISNYELFNERAIYLTTCVLQEFSVYFEATGSWNQPEINSRDALEVIKKASQKFINESVSITLNDDDNVDEEFDIGELENNEIEIEDVIEDIGINLEDGNDEMDCVKDNSGTLKNVKNCENVNVSTINSDCWKLPISFKMIYLTVKGVLESSSELDSYNEHRVQSIQRNQLKYDFHKIFMHKKKLEIVCSLCSESGHRKEYCNDAIPKFEEMKDILKVVTSEWLLQLKNILMKKYESTVPSKERCETNEKIFLEINGIIKNIYPTARPQMFGSSHNGFMTRASDIDICLEFVVEDKRQNLSTNEIVARLRNIGRDLKKSVPGIDISFVLHAKVPIIKFFLKDNIQGDISINNSLAIQNTRMLKLYADLFPNMRVLGNLLKFIAKSCDIGDASQGTLSSYAYIVMLIHFLQRRGLLPVLQELYEGDTQPSLLIDGWNAWYQTDINLIVKLWKPAFNCRSLEYLWLDFFYYYSVEFDINKEVISINQSNSLFKIDKGWQISYMSIEDPFDLNHNLSGSLSLDKCRYILQCFAHILKLHSNNENLKRNENTYYLLMEPANLRPAIVNTRTCFQCNKQGHVARDCTEKPNIVRQTTKSGELPNLTLPFQYKESTIANHYYLETDFSDSASNISIPIKNFSCGPNDFSVVPITLSFGEKSVVIPMLIGKDKKISTKLNKMLQNGLQPLCPLSAEMLTCNIKIPDILHPVTTATNANNKFVNNKVVNNVSNPNTKNVIMSNVQKNINVPLTKKGSTQLPNNRMPQEYINHQGPYYGPPINQNFAPNPVRMMQNHPNYNNSVNMFHFDNNATTDYQYRQIRPSNDQYQGQPRNYIDYQHMPASNYRHPMGPSNRFNKGNGGSKR